MRIFQLKACARLSRREGVDDKSLVDAVARAERGMVDADLGHGLIKQRIARPGAGRSRGFRFLLAFKPDHRSVFLFGFAKSARANLTRAELQTAQELAESWLGIRDELIEQALSDGELIEVLRD